MDECSADIDNCNPNAVCTNFNGAASGATKGFECICPPGLLGDGVSECQLYAFMTEFTVANPVIASESFDEASFKNLLISSSTIPYNISLNRIVVTASAYTPSSARRSRMSSSSGKIQQKVHQLKSMMTLHQKLPHLQAASVRYSASGRRILQAPGSGTTITVSVASVSAEEQSIMTAGINVTNLEISGFVPISLPKSVMSSTESIDEPIYSTAAGFQISSVRYNDSDARWVVTVHYTPDAPNVVASLYISKPGAKPYTVDAVNSYFVSQHPCLLSDSVCCMNDYKRIYAVGSFQDNITSSVGTCDASVQSTETLALGFNPESSSYIIDHIFKDYPDSYVERISAGEVKLHIAQTDLLLQGLAKKDPLPDGSQDGYLLTFFVGMTYFTLLPANALSVTASQVQVQLSVSNSLTFSFSSAQDYTVLKYITMSLIQTKWIHDFVEKKMQFVKVGFVLPTGLRQNMNTGLVPLTSIRFAVAKTTPNQLNASEWTNPCYSGDSSALYDTTNSYGYHDMYQQAQQQTCAARQNLCTNPTDADVTKTSNLVNFYFPIGDNTITPEILSSFPAPYFMYVYFQLSALDAAGSVVVTNLFAKAQLNALSLSKTCELVTAEVSLLGSTKVDIGVGMVGLDSDWNTTMRIFRDVTQSGAAEGAQIDSTNLTAWGNNSRTARTIQSGLISLVVSGNSALFSRASASQFYIDVEQLTTMHFLDATRFRSMVSLIQGNNAFNIATNPANERPYINFTEEAMARCDRLSCAFYNNIYGGSIKRSGSVHSFSNGIGTTSTSATRDWIMNNVLQATDDYSRDLATNMTSLVRQQFSIDDRITKAWCVLILCICLAYCFFCLSSWFLFFIHHCHLGWCTLLQRCNETNNAAAHILAN